LDLHCKSLRTFHKENTIHGEITKMSFLDKAKKKAEQEAKKAADATKKAGKKGAKELKKAGGKGAKEVKKAAKKAKEKI